MTEKKFGRLNGFVRAIIPLVIVLVIGACLIVGIILLIGEVDQLDRYTTLQWITQQMPWVVRDIIYGFIMLITIFASFFGALKYFKKHLILWVKGETYMKFKTYELEIKYLKREKVEVTKERDEYRTKCKAFESSINITTK
jgi:hypothetical protein